MKSRKATIGATMTWVVATIIILFVIIIFVYASGVLAGSDWFKNIIKGQGSIKIAGDSSVDTEQMLLALLETKFDNKEVKDYILEKNFDNIESDVKSILNKFPNPYLNNKEKIFWLFRIYLKENNVFILKKEYKEDGVRSFETGVDTQVSVFPSTNAKSSSVILSDDAKVELYVGIVESGGYI